MTHTIQIGLAAALLLVSGYLHGVRTDRWGSDESLTQAVQALEQIPAKFGDWASQEVPIPPAQLQIAEAAGHVSRQYVNLSNGTAVSVMILCGRPGPIAVHPPTVCFTGAGFRQITDPSAVTIGEPDKPVGEFFRADFGKDDAAMPVRIRTWWGWSTDGQWAASPQPRRDYAGQPHLYKIYFTRQLRSDAELTDDDPAVEFMQAFLPTVRKALRTDEG